MGDVLGEADFYKYRKHFGVNLGGWLIFEKWMIGDAFGDHEDEFGLQTDCVEDKTLKNVRAKHLTGYISDGDLDKLQLAGVTSVRIPIGYWCLPNDKAVKGTPWEPIWKANFEIEHDGAKVSLWTLLLQMIKKLGERQIGVLIQYHGAPGCQNGEQHSGHAVSSPGLYGNPDHEKAYLHGIKELAKGVKELSNVFGIGILNESHPQDRLRDLTGLAISEIREFHPEVAIVVSDCWAPDHWIEFCAKDKVVRKYTTTARSKQKVSYGPIWLDHHYYRCHSEEDVNKSPKEHQGDLKGPSSQDDKKSVGKSWSNFERFVDLQGPSRPQFMIGEWSASIHHKEGEVDPKSAETAFATLAYRMFSELTAGHFYWSYQHHWNGGEDNPNTWHWGNMLQAGSLRQPYQPEKTDRDLGALIGMQKEIISDLVNSHKAYWKEGCEPEIYQTGLEFGFSDTLAFAHYNKQGGILSLSAHWLALRAPKSVIKGTKDGSDHYWEFIHGYQRGRAIVLKWVYDWPQCLVQLKGDKKVFSALERRHLI